MVTFEKKLSRLEEIVETMESTDVTLADSLKMFEEGVKITKECQSQLTKVEEKIKVLMGTTAEGGPDLRDFSEND